MKNTAMVQVGAVARRLYGCRISLLFSAFCACATAQGTSLAQGRPGDAALVREAASEAPSRLQGTPQPKEAAGDPPLVLAFADFFEPRLNLVPTAKVLGASGRHVRVVGFMVRMEVPAAYSFYLAPKPLFCDEAGGGTADLSPDAVRVNVPWAGRPEIPFVPGLLQVDGKFEVGSRADDDGRVSMFRLLVDSRPSRPLEQPPLAARASSNAKP